MSLGAALGGAQIAGGIISALSAKNPEYIAPEWMDAPGAGEGRGALLDALRSGPDIGREVSAFRNARRAIQNRAAYASSLLPREVSDAVSSRYRYGNAALEAALATKRQRELDLGTEQAEAGYDIQQANLVRDLENRRLSIASSLASRGQFTPGRYEQPTASGGEILGQVISGAGRVGLEQVNQGRQDDRMKALLEALRSGGGGYQAEQYRPGVYSNVTGG